jgi:ATP-dependent RNA helicase DeaD
VQTLDGAPRGVHTTCVQTSDARGRGAPPEGPGAEQQVGAGAAFAALGAHPSLLRALAARGFDQPTPVQSAVLAEELRERDLLVSSRTGSGKTVAFGLALAAQLLPGGRDGKDGELQPEAGQPLALVIAPTRELALQVSSELSWLYAKAGARVVSCVGGREIAREARALRDGAHLVVGTPGRLCDHLDRKTLRLSALRALVLDEADEMLDMGFRDELERILRDAPAQRRTLFFSATLPRGIEELARKYQREAARVAATPPSQAHQDIEVRAHLIAVREREHAVVNTLRLADSPSAIVFCATREGVSHLHASLAERGFAAVALSGELTQPERTRALQALRDGRARVLVATDVAARGLDLPEVGLVIQADLPHDAQVLQHRSGRTGRAGRKGVSVLLVPSSGRRSAERLLRDARVQAVWSLPPSAEQVRALDQERLRTALTGLEVEATEEDRALARALIAARGAEELVAALVRTRREALPAPEELPLSAQVLAAARAGRATPAGPRAGPGPTSARARPGGQAPHARAHPHARTAAHAAGARPAAGARSPSASRASPGGHARPAARADKGSAAEDAVWFRVDVGRSRNADPRWLLPLLCRRGQVSKPEIGKIRILAAETHFQVARHAAQRFGRAAQRPDEKDPQIHISELQSRPEPEAPRSRARP